MTPLSAREFLELAGDHLWQSTLFAGAAALVAVALRRYGASLRFWVWLAASLKFFVPFAALVALGGYGSWRSVEVVPYRESPVLIETVGQPFSRETVALNAPGPRRVADAGPSRLPAALLAVWAIGAAVFLTRSLIQWRRVQRVADGGSLLEDGREVRILRRLEASGGPSTHPLPLVASDTSLEPGVFGIFRPKLLWPRAISERLTDEQLEAVLAHELCHLRRSDNFTAVLHIAVQTVFWFHPLTWWIGARLIDERERACDEEVIRRGSERETYAESILKTCKFFVESPLPCISGVTGSDLKKRIEDIMTRDSVSSTGRWNKALLTLAGVLTFITPVAVGALNPPAQTREVPASASLPAFEAVSVRQNMAEGRGGRGGGQMQPGRYVAQDLTLKNILRRAYGETGVGGPNTAVDLLEQQVAGGPEWVAAEKWDVIATTRETTPPPQMRLMVQRMLADRFQLKAHWEKREMPVYVLTMARPDGRPGQGLTLASEEECAAARRDGPPPMPTVVPGQPLPPSPPPPCGAIQFGPGQLIARGTPMELFVQTLTNVPVITGIDRPVVDRTGLKGNWGFQLKFAPATNPNPDPDRPHFITALQEQLGLKLEATRAPVDVLVIDSVAKPQPN